MNEPTRLAERKISAGNKAARLAWSTVWLVLYRPSLRPMHAWRRALLRLFGAKIGRGVRVYQSARIWAPWNLEMDDNSCLGDFVDCYSVDKIYLGVNATVSQYSYLCTATHDYTRRSSPLVTAPIRVETDAWVTAGVFVGPGVTVGEGAVVGARSTVTHDVPAWTVCAGIPARVLKTREIVGE